MSDEILIGRGPLGLESDRLGVEVVDLDRRQASEARVRAQPRLFKGGDLSATDLVPAIQPEVSWPGS